MKVSWRRLSIFVGEVEKRIPRRLKFFFFWKKNLQKKVVDPRVARFSFVTFFFWFISNLFRKFWNLICFFVFFNAKMRNSPPVDWPLSKKWSYYKMIKKKHFSGKTLIIRLPTKMLYLGHETVISGLGWAVALAG